VSDETGHRSVRRSYDAVAEEYTLRLSGELAYKPLDRALLAALVEQTEPGAPVADVGCGPGHVAAWVTGLGAEAVGIDLSRAMVSIARREHPEVEFRQGDILSLPAADAEFGAAVALYSIIHLDPAELRPAFEELHRVIRASGLLLVSFHVGTEVRHLDEWWGTRVDVDFRFLETEAVSRILESTGFVLEARLERNSYPEEVETHRAYLLARRKEREAAGDDLVST
jgi:ubiquinone/menaquinone biosynthesis C-methylase UbiE